MSSNNTIYHTHHIIPKYLGGSDDPSNLVQLTVEEHAEAHRKLYEEYGDIRDKLAWKGLLGIVGKEDIVKQLSGISRGSKWYYNPENPTERKMIRHNQEIPNGWILGRGTNTWAANRNYKNVSDAQIEKVKNSMKQAWARGDFENRKKRNGHNKSKEN